MFTLYTLILVAATSYPATLSMLVYESQRRCGEAKTQIVSDLPQTAASCAAGRLVILTPGVGQSVLMIDFSSGKACRDAAAVIAADLRSVGASCAPR